MHGASLAECPAPRMGVTAAAPQPRSPLLPKTWSHTCQSSSSSSFPFRIGLLLSLSPLCSSSAQRTPSWEGQSRSGGQGWCGSRVGRRCTHPSLPPAHCEDPALRNCSTRAGKQVPNSSQVTTMLSLMLPPVSSVWWLHGAQKGQGLTPLVLGAGGARGGWTRSGVGTVDPLQWHQGPVWGCPWE